jgi:hypothetical protein
MNKSYQRGYTGVDNIGRPIFCDCLGKIDAATLISEIGEEGLWNYFYWTFEVLLKHYLLACSDLYDR